MARITPEDIEHAFPGWAVRCASGPTGKGWVAIKQPGSTDIIHAPSSAVLVSRLRATLETVEVA